MKFHSKGFTSLFLAAAFLVLGSSGIVLYMTPRGRVANWTGWTMLGLEKQDWQAVHMNLAVLFLIVTGWHLYLNWPVFWGYIKRNGSFGLNLETMAALLLVGFVLVGAILRIPPLKAVVDFNYQIKDYWERRASEVPVPHAEELRLSQFADTLGLSVSDIQRALQAEGVVIADTSATIQQVAEANNLTPADVYAVIRKHFPETDQRGKGQGKGQGRGQGRGQGKDKGREIDQGDKP